MENLTTTTLDAVTNAIVVGLQEALAGFEGLTVVAYPGKEKLQPPAVFVELSDFSDGVDDGTGRDTLELRWEARILVDDYQDNPKRAARNLAIAVALAVRQTNWGIEALDFGELIGGFGDEYRADLPDLEAYRVEWTNGAALTPAFEWGNPAIVSTPEHVNAGIAPTVGTGHEDDYDEVTP